MMNVLVTGGAGYIGSHVVEELQKNGFTPIVYDNLSTGHAAAVPEEVQLVEGDIHDVAFLKHIMAQFEIDAVIHFAASSLVGESMENPSKYYFNNVEGSLHLLEAMKGAGVDYIVFSSTAAVYGEPEGVPIKEDSCLNPTNVYGRTKLMIEKCWLIMIWLMRCVMWRCVILTPQELRRAVISAKTMILNRI